MPPDRIHPSELYPAKRSQRPLVVIDCSTPSACVSTQPYRSHKLRGFPWAGCSSNDMGDVILTAKTGANRKHSVGTSPDGYARRTASGHSRLLRDVGRSAASARAADIKSHEPICCIITAAIRYLRHAGGYGKANGGAETSMLCRCIVLWRRVASHGRRRWAILLRHSAMTQ
jgi:hypothetical protein